MEKKTQEKTVPQSPEGYPRAVRQQLDQHEQTHEGAKAPAQSARPGTTRHQGATEDEVTPIKPPMAGPADLVGETGEKDTDDLDPSDELTPG